jgi:hypothetical protein
VKGGGCHAVTRCVWVVLSLGTGVSRKGEGGSRGHEVRLEGGTLCVRGRQLNSYEPELSLLASPVQRCKC